MTVKDGGIELKVDGLVVFIPEDEPRMTTFCGVVLDKVPRGHAGGD